MICMPLFHVLEDETRSCQKSDIWKEAHLYTIAELLRDNRLRWFGHVQRRDKDEARRRALQMTVDGKRNRDRPKLRCRDLVEEDMARNQMTTEMAEDRKHWRVMIRAVILLSIEAERLEFDVLFVPGGFLR